MALQSCVLFYVVILYSENQFIAAMWDNPEGFYMSEYHSIPSAPASPTSMATSAWTHRPSPPQGPDPWRQNLPLPFEDDSPTMDESLNLFKQGIKQDPCKKFCAKNVSQSEILKDCGGMVAAIKFLAENDHPSVKPECATAREHGCQYTFFLGHSCRFKVNVLKIGFKGKGSMKEKQYKLKDCLNPDYQGDIAMEEVTQQ